MIQGCIDSDTKKCSIADSCKRRKSAETAPRGVTLLLAPFDDTKSMEDIEKVEMCGYFLPE